MPIQSTEDVLKYAERSVFLAANEVDENNLFLGGNLQYDLSNQIYSVKKAVEWMHGWNPESDTLELTVNYLYALCGKYRYEALRRINATTDGLVINPYTGTMGYYSSHWLQIEVGDTAAIQPGDTTYTLSATGLKDGSVTISVDGIVLPYGLSSKMSYTVVYSENAGEIVFNQETYEEQVIIINYEKFNTV